MLKLSLEYRFLTMRVCCAIMGGCGIGFKVHALNCPACNHVAVVLMQQLRWVITYAATHNKQFRQHVSCCTGQCKTAVPRI